MRRFVVLTSAALFLALALNAPEARADGIFFTDPAAYAAALAQRGMTESPIRYNEPGSIQSGSIVSGRVAGVTPSGPGDLTLIISGGGGSIVSLSSPSYMIQGAGGNSFGGLGIASSYPIGPQSSVPITFTSVSGYFTRAPFSQGNQVLITVSPYGPEDFDFIYLDITSNDPVFFGFIVDGWGQFRRLTLIPVDGLRLASVSQLNVGGAAVTPEPLTLVLLGTGLAGVAGVARRGRKTRAAGRG